MPRKRNYINNRDLYESLRDYRNQVLDALENGKPKPQVSEYIGDCFIKLANNLAKKDNFRRYSHIDIMIDSGIEVALKRIDNFDPDKYDNPFGYFTTIMWNEFIQKIKEEENHTYVKYRGFRDNDGLCGEMKNDGSKQQNTKIDFAIIDDYIKNFEDKRKIKRGKKKAT